jgi:alkanesulfonate monooxygenase SsuD/methylene tetrahydromethanopterin reductase-like flavin-dependent oxidoreductase (luciferase family)
MPFPLPAVSLAAVPGRRRATLDLAREIERRGFSGVFCPSVGDALALCEALTLVTDRVLLGTSVQPIYTRHVQEFAQTASFIHELSAGRFHFGVGVSHARLMTRLGVQPGKPLGDMRDFVKKLREVPRAGELPPIVLATLRVKMIRLAGEVAQGIVFANGARSHMRSSIAALPAEKQRDPRFFIGNMIPTCISDDIEAAKAVNRRTLSAYALLPNYRNYWKEAGYAEEMEAVEQALAAGERERIPSLLSDRWLADTTLFGPATRVRQEIEAWYESGVRTPILAPSSALGNQIQAFEELFAALAD